MTIESKIITIKAKPAERQKQYENPISETYKRIAAEQRTGGFVEFIG